MTLLAVQTQRPRTLRPLKRLRKLVSLGLSLSLSLALACVSAAHAAPAWVEALRTQVDRIDKATPGEVGLYVKRLDTGETLSYGADQRWYLASSVKLPIAIAVLQEVEAGRLALNQTLTLKDSDRIEGSGNLVWQATGGRYPVDQLLRRMLMESDNTAANMLVHSMGEDTLNRRAKNFLGAQGFERFTDLAAVRYDVYSEFHPAARKLSNMDLVKIAGAPLGPQRVEALRRTLRIERSELRVPTMDEAYARYYQRDLNTATLQAYGGMLEQLVLGRLVSPEHTLRLFKDLKYDTYDAYRLEAGLPRTVRFIHKTSTQFQRACHMGVIDPQEGGRRAIIVAACAQGLDEHEAAGRMFEAIGRAITQTLLQAPRP